MSTIHNDDASTRELLGVYDVGQPTEAYRARLHKRLQVELRRVTSSQRLPAPTSRRRGFLLSWHGYVTAAVLLAVIGFGLQMTLTSGMVAQRQSASPGESLEHTSALVSVADEGSTASEPAHISAMEQVAVAPKVDEPQTRAACVSEEDSVVDFARTPTVEPSVIIDEETAEPMQFVLHSDPVFTSPDERRWRRAWCFVSEAENSTEVFDGWLAACETAADDDESANGEMAYRVQSAVMAREQLEPLVHPLLADAGNEEPLINALVSIDQEAISNTVAQLNGEMATSAKLYLELLFRSREEQGIQEIDDRLQSVLSNEQLDESRRELVRRCLLELDTERRRRESRMMM